jgi:hypothetical protein
VYHATALRRIALAAALVVVSATVAAEDTASHVAQACVYHPTIKRTRVLNDRNILYVTSQGTFNNQLVKQCPGMRRDAQLSYTLVNQKLCAGSTFTLLREVGASSNLDSVWDPVTQTRIVIRAPQWIPTFTCQLGMFLPVTDDEVEDIIASTDEDRSSRRHRRRNAPEMIKVEPVKPPRDTNTDD